MRVVLDTGILVAALITTDTPPALIYQALETLVGSARQDQYTEVGGQLAAMPLHRDIRMRPVGSQDIRITQAHRPERAATGAEMLGLHAPRVVWRYAGSREDG